MVSVDVEQSSAMQSSQLGDDWAFTDSMAIFKYGTGVLNVAINTETRTSPESTEPGFTD